MTLHFRAHNEAELHLILDVLKARNYRGTDSLRGLTSRAREQAGVIINAYDDKHVGWDEGDEPALTTRIINVVDIPEVMKALGEKGEDIFVECEDGTKYKVEFHGDGALTVGCVYIEPEEFLAIAKRRVEVMNL